jgi:DNA-binding transcriptional MerR regulator
MYKTQEAAKLAGITVRTLHHYDRIGLLKPSGRSEAGYRLYSDADLVRLQHIAVLKFLGFTLSEIRDLIRGAPTGVRETLVLHRSLLVERKQQIERSVKVIDMAEQRGYDMESLKRTMEAMRMSERKGWMLKYYSPEAQEKIRKRSAEWSGEQQAESERRWRELIAEVEEAAKREDPDSDRARELAARWQELIRGFTQDDPEITLGLNRLYEDKANWPADFKRPYSDRAEKFIHRAIALYQAAQ